MSDRSPSADDGVQSTPRTAGVSRRGVLRATGAGLAGAGLAYGTGSVQAAGIDLPPLVRDGNQLVDPQGEPVTLRGVGIADPAEQARCWRGMDSQAVFDVATAHDHWHNTVVRVPMQPEFLYTADVGVNTLTPPCDGTMTDFGPEPDDLPHGDDWGPALPGTFGAERLEAYLESYVDPLVEQAAENGAYLMLEYHRGEPVFHQEEQRNLLTGFREYENRDDVDLADVWHCPSEGEDVDHTALGNEDFDTLPSGGRYEEPCGERGLLWHGADQKDELLQLVDEQAPWEYYDGPGAAPEERDYSFESIDDVYVEPDPVCHALDNEVHLFWAVVADRYAEYDHVLWQVYADPTGPHAGDWGAPQRVPAGPLLSPNDDRFELWAEYAKSYYDLWRQRSQPWMNVVEDNGHGQIATIGSPQWSQYTYWAPYNEHDYENMAYTAHAYLQESLRPLERTIGNPAEHVPTFLGEFGWQDFDLYAPTPWMTFENYDGLEFAVGDPDGEDPFGSLAFEPLLEEYDVHPICCWFDLQWGPNFFEHGTPGEPDGAKDVEHWYDEGYLIEEETPGQWWRLYVEETVDRDDYAPNPGEERYPDADTSRSDLHGTSIRFEGYACEVLGNCRSPPPPQCPEGEAEQLANGTTVCDLDGDGNYQDLTATGDTTTQDLQYFFEHQHREPYDSRTDLFDYTGNDDVGQPDVVDLFHAI